MQSSIYDESVAFSSSYSELIQKAYDNNHLIYITTLTWIFKVNVNNIDLIKLHNNFNVENVIIQMNKNKQNTQFYNQITLKFVNISTKSIKIFKNGQIQVTGLSSYFESIDISTLLLGWLNEFIPLTNSQPYEMINNSHIDLITFTGSVGVGKYIAEQAGYKRTVLELGGNDPLIVLNDLSDDDLKKAVELAVTGATKNSGQRCTAVKRILCQNKIADKFVAMALERAKQITYGDPMDLKTDLGTVVNTEAAELFDKRVSMAEEEGAKVLYHPGRKGALLPPIVVDNVNPKSELVLEETFGPVIPIIRVPDNDDEVITISNSTAFGLSSGVCTNNFIRAKKYIQNLNVGTVNIWEVPGYRIEMSPFGGIKDSGLGYKEGVIEAMKSFTNVKTFSLPW